MEVLRNYKSLFDNEMDDFLLELKSSCLEIAKLYNQEDEF